MTKPNKNQLIDSLVTSIEDYFQFLADWKNSISTSNITNANLKEHITKWTNEDTIKKSAVLTALKKYKEATNS